MSHPSTSYPSPIMAAMTRCLFGRTLSYMFRYISAKAIIYYIVCGGPVFRPQSQICTESRQELLQIEIDCHNDAESYAPSGR